MLTYVWSQIRHRVGRSAILVLGVALAAASVVVLTGAARTSQLQVTGTVKENLRSAYDIVVRPEGSKTELERRRGLVQGNYLSGLYGGISRRQVREIAALPDVEVAAPVANLGYTLVPQRVVVDLHDLLTDDPAQVYRITSSVSADQGLSTYPGETGYVYFTRQHRFVQRHANDNPREVLASGRTLRVCDGYWRSPDWPRKQSLAHPDRHWLLSCFSARSPDIRRREYFQDMLPKDIVGFAMTFTIPVQVAAINPAAEQRLVGLADATTSGRPLTAKDRTRWVERFPTAPVVASSRTYVADRLDIRVERLELPDPDRVPELLASQQAYELLTTADGETASRQRLSTNRIWQRLLADYRTKPQFIEESYTPRSLHYRPRNGGFVVSPVTGNWAVYTDTRPGNYGSYVPVDSADTQLRRLIRLDRTNVIASGTGEYGFGKLQVVGTYDPAQLRGFSELSAVPLTSYRPPQVRITEGGGDATGRRLLPDRNLGGYLTQPPMLLTTMKGMSAFLNAYVDPGRLRHKPVSSVRVRVAGAPGIDPTSQARIERVALEIHRRTGLDVDVTLGSSPAPQSVILPAGRYGRPELTVEEYWVKKGVAVTILEAVDRKSAALLGLLGLVCVLFVANTATAAMRARRPQFGVLTCLGWSAGRLFAAAILELVTLGLLGGLLGLALAGATAAVLDISLLAPVVTWLIPAVVALSILAGLFAASRAARITPADAIRPPTTGAHRARGRVRGVLGLALRSLGRVPGRTAVSTLALAVGIAALTVLLALTVAFKGTVAGSLLGEAVILEVTATDYLAVAVTALLAAAIVAETLFLEVRERAPELAALSASGWRDSRLARLLSYEGIGIGLLGSLSGAAVGLTAAALLNTPVAALAAAAALAIAAGVALAAIAAIGPALTLRRMSVPQLLAEE